MTVHTFVYSENVFCITLKQNSFSDGD